MLIHKIEGLARKWAAYVSRDSALIMWSLILTINGILFIALHFLVIESTILVVVGVLLVYTAFLLFERSGFIQLLDEGRGKDAGSENQDTHDFPRKSENQDTHDFPRKSENQDTHQGNQHSHDLPG